MPLNISGAIHPLVPASPDRCENDRRPVASFLHRPKSEIIARTRPCAESGRDSSTLCGFTSLCTTHTHTPSSRAIFHVNLSLLVALLILTDEQCKILRGRMLFLMPMMAITHSSSSFFNTKRRNTVDTHVLHTCTETLEYVNNSTGLPHLQFTGKQKRKHT